MSVQEAQQQEQQDGKRDAEADADRIAENFARIFRQNMFNCGLMAIQLDAAVIDEIFKTFAGTEAELTTDLDKQTFTITNGKVTKSYPFTIGDFDRELVKAGGWVSYADKKY